MSGKLLAVVVEEKPIIIGHSSLTIEVIAFVERVADKNGNVTYIEKLPKKISVRLGIFYFNQWFHDEYEIQERAKSINASKELQNAIEAYNITSLARLLEFTKIDAEPATKEEQEEVKQYLEKNKITRKPNTP